MRERNSQAPEPSDGRSAANALWVSYARNANAHSNRQLRWLANGGLLGPM